MLLSLARRQSILARVAKLADALDLGSSGPKALGGSTPPSRTTWRRDARSGDEGRCRVPGGVQAAPLRRGAPRRRAARVGTRLRPRAEAGAPARISQGPRAALAGEAPLRGRRAPRGCRA